MVSWLFSLLKGPRFKLKNTLMSIRRKMCAGSRLVSIYQNLKTAQRLPQSHFEYTSLMEFLTIGYFPFHRRKYDSAILG